MSRDGPLLSCVEVEPEKPANAAVIWLHGLGADGHDFEPIVPVLGLAPGVDARFVFPHAPNRPVTVNAGMVMPAWYDILAVALEREVDERGVLESAEQIFALIARERDRGIEPGRVVLAGFSQGGAIALHVALRYPDRLAGVIAVADNRGADSYSGFLRGRADLVVGAFLLFSYLLAATVGESL